MGRCAGPRIGDQPYFLNLGPFAFYWFSIERRAEERGGRDAERALGRRRALQRLLQQTPVDPETLGEQMSLF